MTSTMISLVACTMLAPCPSYDSGPGRWCIQRKQAESCLESVLAGLRQDQHAPAAHYIWTLERLAILRMNQGSWDIAMPLVKEAYERSLKMEGLHPAQSEAAGMLAAFHRRQGSPARALPLLRRSLAIDHQLFGEMDPHAVPVLIELGTLLIGEGRESESAKLLERARRIITVAKMEWSREKLLLDLGWAELSMKQKRWGESDTLYRRSLDHPALDALSKVHVHAALSAIARQRKNKDEQRTQREQGIALARQFPGGAALVKSIFGPR